MTVPSPVPPPAEDESHVHAWRVITGWKQVRGIRVSIYKCDSDLGGGVKCPALLDRSDGRGGQGAG